VQKQQMIGNPRGNTAPMVLPQMHYRYRGSTVRSVPSPRYYCEILPIPTVITTVTAVLPHSPLPCHSLALSIGVSEAGFRPCVLFLWLLNQYTEKTLLLTLWFPVSALSHL